MPFYSKYNLFPDCTNGKLNPDGERSLGEGILCLQIREKEKWFQKRRVRGWGKEAENRLLSFLYLGLLMPEATGASGKPHCSNSSG